MPANSAGRLIIAAWSPGSSISVVLSAAASAGRSDGVEVASVLARGDDDPLRDRGDALEVEPVAGDRGDVAADKSSTSSWRTSGRSRPPVNDRLRLEADTRGDLSSAVPASSWSSSTSNDARSSAGTSWPERRLVDDDPADRLGVDTASSRPIECADAGREHRCRSGAEVLRSRPGRRWRGERWWPAATDRRSGSAE